MPNILILRARKSKKEIIKSTEKVNLKVIVRVKNENAFLQTILKKR